MSMLGLSLEKKKKNLKLAKSSKLPNFHSMVQNQFQAQIHVLRMDNGREYFHSIFRKVPSQTRNDSLEFMCRHSTIEWGF